MGRKLTDQEIRKQLQAGRNYKRLYFELKVKYDAVLTENKQLRAENERLQHVVATLQIQVAELQTMVFGKKRRPPSGHAAATPNPVMAPLPRLADSYRRPIPPASAITTTMPLALPDECPHCGSRGDYVAVQRKHYYVEDIPLPDLTPGYQARLVTDYVVPRGRCTTCGHTAAGMTPSSTKVGLGPNVRLLVCDLVARLGLSYSQVLVLLSTLYGLVVSDGEIAAILEQKHQAWLPAGEQLKADLRSAPVVHLDETPWPLQSQAGHGYAWVLADAKTGNVWYELESSRGVQQAQRLLGDQFQGVRVSDDYGAYRALPGQQQLCWVHLYRTIRDLKDNTSLPPGQRPAVEQWYGDFSAIYTELRANLASAFDATRRQAQAASLWQRLQVLLPTSAGEPVKLARLKAQLSRAGPAKLFTCLLVDTPCDNNRAERELRQLVLKRRRSFGSKTLRGAKALATILSICTTTWRRLGSSPAGYYQALSRV